LPRSSPVKPARSVSCLTPETEELRLRMAGLWSWLAKVARFSNALLLLRRCR
jgi:hypothetical protein